MKLRYLILFWFQQVASRVEAWIETVSPRCFCQFKIVASRVEAWIETNLRTCWTGGSNVASRVEAWIETMLRAIFGCHCASPPAWRRGLKQMALALGCDETLVASRVEAWIETASCLTWPNVQSVASRVEAWIETTCRPAFSAQCYCRLPRGGVD